MRQRGAPRGVRGRERHGVTTDQYAPAVPAGGHSIAERPASAPIVTGVARRSRRRSPPRAAARRPRARGPEHRWRCPGDHFDQADGPFTTYRRTLTRVSADGDSRWRETTHVPARRSRGSRGCSRSRCAPRSPGAARHRPTSITTRRRRADAVVGAARTASTRARITVLGLLAAASMSSAFVNTLFTQTVNFAADDFGVGDTGIGIAGSVVRAGIILVLPVAVLADRIGRRRVVTGDGHRRAAGHGCWRAGADASRSSSPPRRVGRPLGLALDFLDRRRRRRGDAPQQPGLRGQRAGHGQRARRRRRRDGPPARRHLAGLVALRVPRRPSSGSSSPSTSPAGCPRPRRFERPHVVAPPTRPPPVRRARRGRPARQPVRRPGQPLPERLPRGRPRLTRRR